MYNQTNRKREPYDKAHLSFGLQRYCFFRYSANISLFCQRKVANAADSLFTSAKKRCIGQKKRCISGLIDIYSHSSKTYPIPSPRHKKGSLTHSPDRLFLYHFRGITPPGSSPLRTYCLPLPAYAACSARSLP